MSWSEITLKLSDAADALLNILRGVFAGLATYYVSFFYPIEDFFKVIIIVASCNIAIGIWVDRRFYFKKAFMAFVYLIGYFSLLGLSMVVGRLMKVDNAQLIEFSSWITWILLYFYVANILRNWSRKQPENKPIRFLYWVFSFKVVEKIKYLKEFKEQENENTEQKKP